MATRVQVPVEGYLRTSFEGADCEYLDGEIRERNVGNNPHSRAQWRLCSVFLKLSEKFRLYGRPELRLRLSPSRYRVADLAVFAEAEPTETVPSSPPLVVIEILSPDDRMTEMLEKLEEYHAWGVRHVWLVDPASRKLYVFSPAGLQPVEVLSLTEYEAEIPAAVIF